MADTKKLFYKISYLIEKQFTILYFTSKIGVILKHFLIFFFNLQLQVYIYR